MDRARLRQLRHIADVAGINDDAGWEIARAQRTPQSIAAAQILRSHRKAAEANFSRARDEYVRRALLGD